MSDANAVDRLSLRDLRYTEEQVDAAVRLLKSGTPVADVCRQTGIAEATLHLWKKTIVTLGFPEAREGRELREENARLMRLLARPSSTNDPPGGDPQQRLNLLVDVSWRSAAASTRE